jgi:hypothetical protein
MCSMLSEYSKYTTDTTHTAGVMLAAKYDPHNKINDKAACKFILLQTLHLCFEPNNTFHVLWLELIKAVHSTSIDRFDDLKAKLKLYKATDYAGQNIDGLSKAYNKDAGAELTYVGQYEHNITLCMLKTFLEASGRNNESYHFKLRLLKKSLDTELLGIGHMSKDNANKHMVQAYLPQGRG